MFGVVFNIIIVEDEIFFGFFLGIDVGEGCNNGYEWY